MGVHYNVSFNEFPKQSKSLHKLVIVCFNYDTSRTIEGKIIRDDSESPYVTLIQLADGRVVMSGECQYSIK